MPIRKLPRGILRLVQEGETGCTPPIAQAASKGTGRVQIALRLNLSSFNIAGPSNRLGVRPGSEKFNLIYEISISVPLFASDDNRDRTFRCPD